MGVTRYGKYSYRESQRNGKETATNGVAVYNVLSPVKPNGQWVTLQLPSGGVTLISEVCEFVEAKVGQSRKRYCTRFQNQEVT